MENVKVLITECITRNFPIVNLLDKIFVCGFPRSLSFSKCKKAVALAKSNRFLLGDDLNVKPDNNK